MKNIIKKLFFIGMPVLAIGFLIGSVLSDNNVRNGENETFPTLSLLFVVFLIYIIIKLTSNRKPNKNKQVNQSKGLGKVDVKILNKR